MRKTLLASFVVPLALLTAACGDSEGDGLSAREQEYADAMELGLEGGAELDIADEDITCMAEALVTEVGLELLEEEELEPEDFEEDVSGEVFGEGTLSDAVAGDVIDGWQDCTDLPVLLASASFPDDEDAAECYAEGLDDESIDLLMVPLLTTVAGVPSEEDQAQFIELAEGCVGEEEPATDGATDEAVTGDGGGATDGEAPPADVQTLLIEGLTANFSESGVVDETQARCLAEGMVQRIGADRLYAAIGDDLDFGSAPQDMVVEIGTALEEAATECGVETDGTNG